MKYIYFYNPFLQVKPVCYLSSSYSVPSEHTLHSELFKMTTVGATADGLEQIDDRIDINAATHRDLVFDDNFDHASIPFEKEEWPVLIVGSSLVGMLTGLLLGYHGYCLRYDRLLPHN